MPLKILILILMKEFLIYKITIDNPLKKVMVGLLLDKITIIITKI